MSAPIGQDRTVKPPHPRPCESCPYRRDVPSGVWDASEYRKLPDYDRVTYDQPIALFMCHQGNGHVCSGWAGCHDMQHTLAVRFAAMRGDLDEATIDATLDYVSPGPDRDVQEFALKQARHYHPMSRLEHRLMGATDWERVQA